MTKPFPSLKPPYFMVVFTSTLASGQAGYEEMSKEMVSMVSRQSGFLGFDSVRGSEGLGITVSYWENLEAIRNWKLVPEHQEAQKRGIGEWYSHYSVRIAEVLEDRAFES